MKETFAGRPAAAAQQNLKGDFELFVFNVFKCLGPGDPGRPLGGAAWVRVEARALPCVRGRVHVAVTPRLGVLLDDCDCSAKLTIPSCVWKHGLPAVTQEAQLRANVACEGGCGVSRVTGTPLTQPSILPQRCQGGCPCGQARRV